jgi:hypothetical protein
VAVLDAGGLPQPMPFVPTSPSIYETRITWAQNGDSPPVSFESLASQVC